MDSHNVRKRILVLGASSALSQACLRLWAKEDTEFFLVAKDSLKLNTVVDDLKLRKSGVRVHHASFDLVDTRLHSVIFQKAVEAMGAIDTVFVCFGILGNETLAQENYDECKQIFDINFLAHSSLLLEAAKNMDPHSNKNIVVVSSVAGDRGRASNFVYGSSKAGLIAFVSGLRAKLFRLGIHVMDVRPGLMDSPMTKNFEKKGLLWSSPDRVAKSIFCGIKCRKNVVYAPGFWYFVMFIIRHLPEGLFKRLRF